MRLAVVAHRESDTNAALVAAGRALGIDTVQLAPREALHSLKPGDVALGRLDVLETLDGVEEGMRELEKLPAAGVTVLNPPAALAATHDKLLTARALRRAGLPHPHTWLIADGLPPPVPELPVVLKPRHGSRGRGVTLCRTHEEVEAATRALYTDQGVLAQELVPPLGWDARLVVAGGRVVGAVRRSVPFVPPPLARTLAVLAADAVHGDLVGVDLLPTTTGWMIAELNGAVDFGPAYGEDVSVGAVLELLRVAGERRAAAA